MATLTENLILHRAEDFIAPADYGTVDISEWDIRFIVKATNDATAEDSKLLDVSLVAHEGLPGDKLLHLTPAHIAELGNKTCYWVLLRFYGEGQQKVLKQGTIKAVGFAV